MWNQKDLPEPPVMSYKTHKQDLDLIKLRNALQEGIKHFKNSNLLSNEAALLSRILYRMKMKFRSSKDFKLLEKLCRSLEIYFSTHMARHFKNILDMTPARYKIETYLPTRNMLNYVLVRLQGLVKLMERVYDTCLIAATELLKRFSIGHFWKLFLILFGLVSRISSLVKYNTKKLCDLYGKLLPHSYKLENCGGNNWLPDEYVLPIDLRAWLSVQWVNEDEFVDLTCEPVNEVMNFFNLVDDDEDDDVQFCDEYILLDDEERQIAKAFGSLGPLKESLSRNRMRGFSINEDDIGEEITEVIEINETILDPGHSEDSSARVLNTISEHELSDDIAEESIELIDDNGSNTDEVSMKIDLAPQIDEKSVIIVPENSPGADKTLIVLEDTVKKDPARSSESSSKKKKKKSTTKKLRNLILDEMDELNQEKVESKTEAAAKRKLDFTEIASNKKMKTSNPPELQLTNTTSQMDHSLVKLESSVRGTSKRKKKRKRSSQTKMKEESLGFGEIEKKSATKRKLECTDTISNKRRKTGSKENIPNKPKRSRKKKNISGINPDTNSGHTSKANMKRKKNLKDRTTEKNGIESQSSKKKKKLRNKKRKQLEKMKTIKSNKNKSETKKSPKKKLKKPSSVLHEKNSTTGKITKTKAQKLKRKVNGAQQLSKLKEVCHQMINLLMKV